ncbi:hypothetical protein [Agromyces sp. Soil535]|uniref:hypothetical protein n=1 Tax=Agromyces sp. Soil535 TaxID=1736390 RepID=UPI0006FDCB30|nr:hypothetical protein [Agromyces sp. Soil535]KRE28248.1 hypothetical protein ASG80_21455 [Agromyces sp. Soil535]
MHGIVLNSLIRTELWNPWDGVDMDLSILGPKGVTVFGIVLGAVWALGFGVMAVLTIKALMDLRHAGKESNPAKKNEAKKQVAWTASATIAIAVIPTLFLIVISVANAVNAA